MALDVHIYEAGKMGRLLYQIDDRTYGELHPYSIASNSAQAKAAIIEVPCGSVSLVGLLGPATAPEIGGRAATSIERRAASSRTQIKRELEHPTWLRDDKTLGN